MEFSDPAYLLGTMIFISFISIMVGALFLGTENEHEKTG